MRSAIRNFWPVLTLILLAALAFLYARDSVVGCDVTENGGTLHLYRSGVDTTRARFCYASDCRLIADQMTKVERASWSCK